MLYHRITLACIFALICASPSAAQISIMQGRAQLDTLEAMFRADFAIPDVPAHELVDGNPGDLLRPATVRDFALAASDFRTPEGDFRVPAAFSIEVAPFLLANARRLSIREYRARRALYRLRISGATGRDPQQRSSIAFGLRATLVDDGDLRTSDDYINGVTGITTRINDLVVEERLARGRPDPLDPDPIDSIDDLTGERRSRFETLLTAVDSLRRALEDRTWNARVVDVALGTRARAADSLGNDPRMTDYVAWATWGEGFGTWGQLLIGAKGALERAYTADDFTTSASLNARLFIGSNRYKAFAEGQVTNRKGDEEASWFLNAGGEARLFSAVWATFSAGLAWDELNDKDPRLAGRFALKLALPDVANLR